MSTPDRDLSRALIGALTLAAAVMLVVLLRLPGLILSIFLIALVLLVSRHYQSNPENAAIQSSLSYARDDICEVLDAYDQLLSLIHI